MQRDLLTVGLGANAAFSLVTGGVAVMGATGVAPTLGLPTSFLVTLGLGLVGFAMLVARTARAPRAGQVRLIVSADLAWVVVAGVALALSPDLLSGQGRWTLAGVSIVVACLAFVQWVGLRREETA